MSKRPGTPARTFRISDDLWAQAQAKAARLREQGRDVSVSSEVVRFLERWVQR